MPKDARAATGRVRLLSIDPAAGIAGETIDVAIG